MALLRVPMATKPLLNVAVIGAGAIGVDHIKSFQAHPRARVVAIVESSLERGREAADLFKIPEVIADYREVLNRPDVHIISIALPNYLHAPVALDALRASKHVMIDKPMATNAVDAAKIAALARRKRLKLMVGQNQRFSGAAQAVRKLVVDGKLGDVYHARAVWMRRSGIPRIGSWFTQKKFSGGGCTYDIGVHVLDLALHLMGDFNPVAVVGQTYAKYGPRGLGEGTWGRSEIHASRPFDVDDFCLALVKLKSGRTVQLNVSWAAPMETRDINGVQLYGTDGGATTNPLQYLRRSRQGYETVAIKPRAALVPENRMAHFVDYVLGRTKPFVPVSQSLAVQKVLDGIYESSRTAREVRIR